MLITMTLLVFFNAKNLKSSEEESPNFNNILPSQAEAMQAIRQW